MTTRGHIAPHLALVGLMGSGKTAVGAIVAARLGRPLRDSDADIEAREGRTVRELRDASGTEAMHGLEARHLLDVLAGPGPDVVCAAASTIDDPSCREALGAATVLVVWLTATPEAAAARFDDQSHRPRYGADPEAFLARQLTERGSLFRSVCAAELVTEGLSPSELADLVMEVATADSRPG
jgi:shikimate kinase